jgi:peroxiredoxin
VSLAAELQAFKDNFIARAAPERLALIEKHIAQARADAIGQGALRAGAVAPDFALPNQAGATVRLADARNDGPVIIVFYRGGWCPYCNLELRAYQRLLEQGHGAGVRVVAISPQAPEATGDTAQKNALAFDVLSDVGSAVARSFGVAYQMPDELQALYAAVGHALPQINDDDSWTLPVPATFVLDRDGVVVLAQVDVDYRTRLEPAVALQAARALVAPALA